MTLCYYTRTRTHVHTFFRAAISAYGKTNYYVHAVHSAQRRLCEFVAVTAYGVATRHHSLRRHVAQFFVVFRGFPSATCGVRVVPVFASPRANLFPSSMARCNNNNTYDNNKFSHVFRVISRNGRGGESLTMYRVSIVHVSSYRRGRWKGRRRIAPPNPCTRVR